MSKSAISDKVFGAGLAFVSILVNGQTQRETKRFQLYKDKEKPILS